MIMIMIINHYNLIIIILYIIGNTSALLKNHLYVKLCALQLLLLINRYG